MCLKAMWLESRSGEKGILQSVNTDGDRTQSWQDRAYTLCTLTVRPLLCK
jgi:hypothetical protein